MPRGLGPISGGDLVRAPPLHVFLPVAVAGYLLNVPHGR